RVTGESLQAFSKVVDSEQEKTESTQKRYDGGGIHRPRSEFDFLNARRPRNLILRRNKASGFERCLVVVSSLLRTLGELHLLTRDFLVRDQTEQVTDAVEARAPFVVREKDVPGRKVCVRSFEHHVARSRVVEPPTPRA